MTSPDANRIQRLLAAINGDDSVAATEAALELGWNDAQPPTLIDVEVYDRFYNSQGNLANYIDLTCSWPRLKLPQGQMTLMGDDPQADLVLSCDTTVVPVTISVGFTDDDGVQHFPLRWGGRVNVAHDKIAEDGTQTIPIELVGDLTMLDRIVAYPEPFLPIEIQPSEAILIGPGITVLKTLVAENCLRLQLGFNELFDTLGSLDPDWRTWFGTLLLQRNLSFADLMQMVTTPIAVAFTDPLFDPSVWIFIHGRMDTLWKLMVQQLKDNGFFASMDLWLPGEPQPEGMLFPLTVPTLVFNVRDYSSVSGPTQTAFDGGLELGLDAVGAIFGNVLAPFLNPANEYIPPGSNVVIAPRFGVNFTPPWVVFNADIDDSGIVAMDIAKHHPLAWRLVMGGKSPQWLNDFLNATLEWLIDILMMVIGITGIPNSLLDGILDNTFFAFQVFELFNMRAQLGPFGFPEKFFPTQSTYDIDMLFAAVTAAWDVRGYPSAQFTALNGLGYTLGRDIWPGQMATVIRRGIAFTDYLDDAVLVDKVDARAKLLLQVGDGRREEGPMAILQRKIVEAEEDINLLMLAPPNN